MITIRRYCKLTAMIVIACAAVTLIGTGNAAGAIIRVKPNATIASSVVLLADVADVFDSDPQVVDALKRATLMPAPAEGSETEVQFSAIRGRLKSLGFNLADLEMTGNSSVIVRKAASRSLPKIAAPQLVQRVKPPVTNWQIARAKKLLSNAVSNYLSTTDLGEVDIELKLDADWAPQVISGQRSGYEVRGGQPPWDAWQTLTVRFIDRDDVLQTMHMQCRVVPKPLMLVAKYALTAGHVVAPADIGWRAVSQASGPIPELKDLIGRETIRALRPGQPIDKNVLRQVPLVRRGDVVTAIAQIGGIRVKRQLFARSDGAMGERVTLSTLDRREQLEATVSGYHEAIVVNAPARQTRQAATELVRGQSQSANFSANTLERRTVPPRNPRDTGSRYQSTVVPSRQHGGSQ